MTKKTVDRSINIEDWTLDEVLLQVKELNLELKDVTITKRVEYEYDSEYQVPCLTYRDLETDNEYHDRLDKEATFKQSAINRELAEYERLKKKWAS